MAGHSAENNLGVYNAAPVVSYYASLNYLTPCERLLFDGYIKGGSSILDLGVGGGRTTAYLAGRASHYVGLDYAAAMIKACQTKFPHLDFRVADAADLSAFQNEAFDAVVFSFNGIDMLPSAARRACLEHICRVLKPGGVLIFSSHNPRAILVRRGWNRDRLREMARRFSGRSAFGQSAPLYSFLFAGFASLRFMLALGQSAWSSLPRFFKRIPSQMFWRGEGNLADTAHGGLLTHYWIPARAIAELTGFHFRIERIVGNEYPQPPREYAADWYYYVFAKRG
ncbi:MAG: class I SAM-dependent methyltransferase [Candidatus Sulfotelmatobacter sp.]|jgi:SAM-dependent methyltransferase